MFRIRSAVAAIRLFASGSLLLSGGVQRFEDSRGFMYPFTSRLEKPVSGATWPPDQPIVEPKACRIRSRRRGLYVPRPRSRSTTFWMSLNILYCCGSSW